MSHLDGEAWRLEQLSVDAAIQETEMIQQQILKQDKLHRLLFALIQRG